MQLLTDTKLVSGKDDISDLKQIYKQQKAARRGSRTKVVVPEDCC